MLRTIGGVIGGYVAMFACLFVIFSLSYLVLGASGAFQPGSYEVSGAWNVLSIIVSVVAALVGGFVCRLIAGKQGAVWAFVALMLIFSVAKIISEQGKTALPRTGDSANMQAMMEAKYPTWLLYVMPLASAAGILAGARLKRDSA